MTSFWVWMGVLALVDCMLIKCSLVPHSPPLYSFCCLQYRKCQVWILSGLLRTLRIASDKLLYVWWTRTECLGSPINSFPDQIIREWWFWNETKSCQCVTWLTYHFTEIILSIRWVGEINGTEGQTNFSQKVIPPKLIPVPHTQPESVRAQICLCNLVLWEGEQRFKS